MEPLSANDPRAVGDFVLRARLGAGGMGQVYLGSSPAGRAVAVKVVHQQLARDPEFRRRFGREVAAARAVSGMYTAPVVATGLDDDPPWFATAYVPGPSLADVVNSRGALPEAAVWRLAAGLAEALRAVHGSGLVHRDLKPANVLLAADGPHVIDFGISRALEGTALTSTGMVVGTPGYMSPEQAEGATAGPASDVFSLGCVLAYAATGNPPFGTGSAASVLYKIVTAEPDLSGVSPQLRQVIEPCLKKSAAERTALSQLSTAISAASPAVPVAFGSFWPEPLNTIIVSSQAYPAPPQTGSAGPGKPGAAGPQRRAAGQAHPASPQSPAPGTVSPLPSGFQPMASAQAAGPMLPDGYLSAATRGMTGGQPGGLQPGTGQPGAGQPQIPGFPSAQQGARHGPATSALAPGWQSAAATQYPAPSWQQPGGTPTTPWPQPGSPGAGTPVPYAPGRRRPMKIEVPPAVQAAAGLMWTGLGATVCQLIASLLVWGRYSHDAKHDLLLINREHANAMAGHIAVAIFADLLGLIAWIWLATATRRGRGWTSIVGSVLAGLYSIIALTILLATHNDPGVKVFTLIVWVFALASVFLLWSQQTRQFFTAWRR